MAALQHETAPELCEAEHTLEPLAPQREDVRMRSLAVGICLIAPAAAAQASLLGVLVSSRSTTSVTGKTSVGVHLPRGSAVHDGGARSYLPADNAVRMTTIPRWVNALAALLLTGCASTGTMEIGNGRFSSTGVSVRGIQPARLEAVDEANEKCAGLHKKAVIESSDDRGMDACRSSVHE